MNEDNSDNKNQQCNYIVPLNNEYNFVTAR